MAWTRSTPVLSSFRNWSHPFRRMLKVPVPRSSTGGVRVRLYASETFNRQSDIRKEANAKAEQKLRETWNSNETGRVVPAETTTQVGRESKSTENVAKTSLKQEMKLFSWKQVAQNMEGRNARQCRAQNLDERTAKQCSQKTRLLKITPSKTWTEAEVDELKKLRTKHVNWAAIGKELQRSPGACKSKVWRLKITSSQTKVDKLKKLCAENGPLTWAGIGKDLQRSSNACQLKVAKISKKNPSTKSGHTDLTKCASQATVTNGRTPGTGNKPKSEHAKTSKGNPSIKLEPTASTKVASQTTSVNITVPEKEIKSEIVQDTLVIGPKYRETVKKFAKISKKNPSMKSGHTDLTKCASQATVTNGRPPGTGNKPKSEHAKTSKGNPPIKLEPTASTKVASQTTAVNGTVPEKEIKSEIEQDTSGIGPKYRAKVASQTKAVNGTVPEKEIKSEIEQDTSVIGPKYRETVKKFAKISKKNPSMKSGHTDLTKCASQATVTNGRTPGTGNKPKSEHAKISKGNPSIKLEPTASTKVASQTTAVNGTVPEKEIKSEIEQDTLVIGPKYRETVKKIILVCGTLLVLLSQLAHQKNRRRFTRTGI